MGSTTSVLERVGIALATMGPGAVLLNAALRGFRVAAPAALLTAAALGVAGTAWLARRLRASLAEAPARRALVAAWCLLAAVVSIGVTARLSLFMVDSARVEDSIYPHDLFFVQHSCLSAYFQAGRLQRAGVPNLYERTHYEGPRGEPKFIDGFVMDTFLYPPPFLLLSRLGLAVSDDFEAWRAVWFGIEGALVASTLLAVGLWIGGRPGRRMLWLTPLVWLSMPTLVTLQFGNFQLVGIAGAILAMLAFESDRNVLGGALLAPLALSKVFPGILVLLLLWQRRWRAAAWTVGFAIVVLVGSVLVLGEAPFRALLSYHLPRLSSGAAVETILARPDAMATNHSVQGFVEKLGLLHVPGMSQRVAVAVSWAYTLVLLGATAVAAKGSPERLPRVLTWLALLQLTALRSPFVPDAYAQFPLVWIVVLLLAADAGQGWRRTGYVVLLVLAAIVTPSVHYVSRPYVAFFLVHQAVFFGLCLWVIWSRRDAWNGTPISRDPYPRLAAG
jgi:hypothetical protein